MHLKMCQQASSVSTNTKELILEFVSLNGEFSGTLMEGKPGCIDIEVEMRDTLLESSNPSFNVAQQGSHYSGKFINDTGFEGNLPGNGVFPLNAN